jgi:hypothetical protein
VLRLRRPTDSELADLAVRASGEPFTYQAVGATSGPEWPAGYRHDRITADIGDSSFFPDAADRLRRWQPQLGSGIALAATGELAENTTVAMAAPLPLGWGLGAGDVPGDLRRGRRDIVRVGVRHTAASS